MANKEHLAKLKEGVDVWNEWRAKDPTIRSDLCRADLRELNLSKADLKDVNLSGVDLWRANLIEADLYDANLSGANLIEADLHRANLSGANLIGVDLSRADLREANLIGAGLRGANLTEADLYGANFIGVDLVAADLTDSHVWGTTFVNVDLSQVKGLETVKHHMPSTIGIDTIYRSQGKIPESFLRGTGVPENLIAYIPSLVGKGFDYYSCFISYSSKDQDFAERLHSDLQGKGVRCWFAPEDLKIGDKFRQRIDEAIRIYDKLLVVLSRNSIASKWVEEEVEGALEKERKQDKMALFPVRLDDAVMETNQAWAASLRRMRHIGDFTNWKDHDSYQKAFTRLMRDLQGKKPEGVAE